MNHASDEAHTAYLFQCGTEQLFAVSLDKTGANSRGARARRVGFSAKSFNSVCNTPSRRPSRQSPSFEASLHRATTSGAPGAPHGQRGHPNNRSSGSQLSTAQ